MLKKDIHYFERDSHRFIQVQCHIDEKTISSANFYNWIYSLKLDSKISEQDNFKEGFNTSHLNQALSNIFGSDDSFINFQGIYDLILERDLLKNPRICSIMDHFMNLLVVDNIQVFSRTKFRDMLNREVSEVSERDSLLKSIPYNTRVLEAASFDPFSRISQQEEGHSPFISPVKGYQLAKSF